MHVPCPAAARLMPSLLFRKKVRGGEVAAPTVPQPGTAAATAPRTVAVAATTGTAGAAARTSSLDSAGSALATTTSDFGRTAILSSAGSASHVPLAIPRGSGDGDITTPPDPPSSAAAAAERLEEPFEPSSFVGLMQQLRVNEGFGNISGSSAQQYRRLSGGGRRRSESSGGGGGGRRSAVQTPESEAMQILDRYPYRPSPGSTPTSRPPPALSKVRTGLSHLAAIVPVMRALSSVRGGAERECVCVCTLASPVALISDEGGGVAHCARPGVGARAARGGGSGDGGGGGGDKHGGTAAAAADRGSRQPRHGARHAGRHPRTA